MNTPGSARFTRRRFLETLAILLASPLTQAHPDGSARFELAPKRRADARGRINSQAGKSKKTDPRIDALIAQIDKARLSQSLLALASLPTRWSQSPILERAHDWITQQFIAYGYDPTRLHQIETKMPNGAVVRNVLCLPTRLDQGFTLIGAHYDSTSEQPTKLAPGADDNASGVAALLETARLFASPQLERGVGFAAFAGEEQGLFGSSTVADLATHERWSLDVYVNLDMVGHVDPIRPANLTVEYDQGNIDPSNNAAAKAFAFQMAQQAADYSPFSVEHTDIWSSDYMPFEAGGVPCIGLYDGAADASFYHTSNDTAARVDIPRLRDICALLCAFVATTGGLKP